MNDLIHGNDWKDTGAFPRVTLCNFQIRSVGQPHNYTLQCVLMINMFNEKIFIMLWFWYQILLCLTVCSLLYWASMCLLPCINRGFITRHLNLADMPFDPEASCNDVTKFVSGYLHSDGMFVIRMVEMNTGVIFGTELVASLWKKYYNIEDAICRWKSHMTVSGASGGLKDQLSKESEPDEVPIALPPPPLRPPKNMSNPGPTLRFRSQTSKASTESAPLGYVPPSEPRLPPNPWAHHFVAAQKEAAPGSAPILLEQKLTPAPPASEQVGPSGLPIARFKPGYGPQGATAPLASGEQSRLGSYRSDAEHGGTPTKLRQDPAGAVSLDMIDAGETQKTPLGYSLLSFLSSRLYELSFVSKIPLDSPMA